MADRPPYQGNPLQFFSLADVRKAFPYGLELPVPSARRSWKLFGNPMERDFKERCIVPVELPGIGADHRQTAKVEAHKSIADKLYSAFDQIAALGLSYVIRPPSSHYCFRYSVTRKSLLETDSTYPNPGGRPWNMVYAEFDRDHHRFDLPVGDGTDPRWTYLSNHAWGSAIDINPETNPMESEARFDMPREIVRIMAEMGYRWGGFYEHCDRDYMHFEYTTDVVSSESFVAMPAAGCLPFGSPGERESPIKYLAKNERGGSGYYPLQKNQGLHGGIHLPAGSAPAAPAPAAGAEPPVAMPGIPVRAGWPGYIVAARLFPRELLEKDPLLATFCDGQDLGFVLVRHVLDEVPEEKKPAKKAKKKKGKQAPAEDAGPAPTPPQPFCLYSLYMHLVPPDWGTGYAAFADTWVGQFLRMEFGGVVALDPQSPETVGKTFWASQAFTAEDATIPVLGSVPMALKAADGRIVAFAKPTPPAVSKAVAALKKGSVITFDRPALAVAAGDVIGFLERGDGRYLHWEVLSPEGDNAGIDRLLALWKKVDGAAPPWKPIAEPTEDNFLTMPDRFANPRANNEVKQLLDGTDDKLAACLDDADKYWEALANVLREGKDFAAKGERSGARAEAPFTYPLTLLFGNPFHYTPDAADPASKTVKVTYKEAGQVLLAEDVTLASFDEPIELVLSVPAEADSIELWSRDFRCILHPPAVRKTADDTPTVADWRPQRLASRRALLEEILGKRWRNLVLSHINEWHADNLKLQLEARQDSGRYQLLDRRPKNDGEKKEDLDAAVAKFRALTWWARTATGDDPYGEVAMLGEGDRGGSLFGGGEGQLPKDAKIKDMHPVAASWLVDVLVEHRCLKVRDKWPLENLLAEKPADDPAFFAVIPPPKDTPSATTLRFGSLVTLALIQPGYGSSDNSEESGVTFVATAAGQKARVVGSARYVEGAAVTTMPLCSWVAITIAPKAGSADGELKALSPKASQAPSLQAEKPELAEAFVLSRTFGTKPIAEQWDGLVMATKRCPAQIEGFLAFDCWPVAKGKALDTTQPAKDGGGLLKVVAKPFDANRRQAMGLTFEGELIVGPALPAEDAAAPGQPAKKPKKGKKAQKDPWAVKLDDDFTLLEFLKTPKGEKVFDDEVEKFKLALPLFDRLQRLRDACRSASKGRTGRTLQVLWLQEDGLALDVASAGTGRDHLDPTKLLALAEQLPKSPLFNAAASPDRPGVRLAYLPNREGGGALTFSVGLGPVLARLSQALLGNDADLLYIRPRLMIPNFGHAALDFADDDGGAALAVVDGAYQAGADDLRQAVGRECIELVADRLLPPEQRFGFGPIKITMATNGFLTEVPLFGPRAKWGNTTAKIAATIGDEGILAGQPRGRVLVAEWFLLPVSKDKKKWTPLRWGKTFELEARVTQTKSLTELPWPVKARFDATPRLSSLRITPRADAIEFEGTALAMPTNVDLRIVCETQVEVTREMYGQQVKQLAWEAVGEVEKHLHYSNPSPVAGKRGRCDPTGKLVARLYPLAVLERGRQYRFVWQVEEVAGHLTDRTPLGAVKVRDLDVTINTVTEKRSGDELLTPAKE